MPDASIISAVRRAVRALPGWPSLRVLDVSCGDGALIEALDEDGCRVEGSHYREDDYIFRNPRPILATALIHRGVDLTKPLPMASAAYDVAIATEVVEHLPSHVRLVAEMSRILKPGGRLVLSTPNTHRLLSRFQFAFTGQHELRSARLGWHVPAADLYATHFNPVYFPVLHTLLHQQGLHIERMLFTRCTAKAWLLLPLYPIVCAATALEARHALKRSRAGGRDLLRWMLHPRGLFSNELLIVAAKAEQVDP